MQLCAEDRPRNNHGIRSFGTTAREHDRRNTASDDALEKKHPKERHSRTVSAHGDFLCDCKNGREWADGRERNRKSWGRRGCGRSCFGVAVRTIQVSERWRKAIPVLLRLDSGLLICLSPPPSSSPPTLTITTTTSTTTVLAANSPLLPCCGQSTAAVLHA